MSRKWTDRLAALRAVREDLNDLEDHERVGLLLMLWPELHDFVDAICELAPERKEWWLRVVAQSDTRLIEGLTASYEQFNKESPEGRSLESEGGAS